MEAESRQFRYVQNEDAPATLIAGEAAVVTPADSRLHILNAVATEIWERCGGPGQTEAELVAWVLDEFEVERAEAEVEVARFLQDAVAAGFLHRVPAP